MSNRSDAELSNHEKDLLASLEPAIRNAVWSTSAKVYDGPYESEGKWITYPLRNPAQRDDWGDYLKARLTPLSSARDFMTSYCAFGTNRLYTAIAVYRILRELKGRGLLNVQGFDNYEV